MDPGKDRIQTLFLDQSEGPRVFGYQDFSDPSPTTHRRQQSASCYLPQPQDAIRNPSLDSTVSSFSGCNLSDSLSQEASTTSDASSVNSPSLPPWHLVNHQPAALYPVDLQEYDFGYDLPCEFSYLQCYVHFHPSQWEAWITHVTGHFTKCHPPQKTVCTICDKEFRARGNTDTSWRRRMVHIGNHLQNLAQNEHPRPDYHVIEQLWRNGVISDEDYRYQIEYTERPSCDGLVPLGFRKPGGKVKEVETHDLAKEKRELKKMQRMRDKALSQGKGKGDAQILHQF